MKMNFSLVNSRYAANIAGLTLVGGLAATSIYRAAGLVCPMQSAGLACPGCGCGRAAVLLLTSGPIEAFRAQPTAFLFLSSIVILAVTGRLAWISQKKWSSNTVVLLPLHLAFLNLVFQLIRAGAN